MMLRKSLRAQAPSWEPVSDQELMDHDRASLVKLLMSHLSPLDVELALAHMPRYQHDPSGAEFAYYLDCLQSLVSFVRGSSKKMPEELVSALEYFGFDGGHQTWASKP